MSRPLLWWVGHANSRAWDERAAVNIYFKPLQGFNQATIGDRTNKNIQDRGMGYCGCDGDVMGIAWDIMLMTHHFRIIMPILGWNKNVFEID